MKNIDGLALATIVETQGSSPQIPGASAVFSSSGLMMGTLGGGILEGHSQQKAIKALKSKSSLLAEFDLTSDSLLEEEAICGGQVKVLIDAIPEKNLEIFQNLSNANKKRIPGVLVTAFGTDPYKKAQILRYWIDYDHLLEINSILPHKIHKKELLDVLAQKKPKLLRLKDNLFPENKLENYIFLEPIFPLPQLVIAGAGHIGQALAHLGTLLNFDVTVIDDRAEYANTERFPQTDNILVGDIGPTVKSFPISSDTFIVIVTRGHRYDAKVLKNCISSSAAYVGVIGSRRKIALLKEKFLTEGWATQEEMNRVHAPIGLEINSKTVEEIAVSIAAQLVLVRSQTQGERRQT
ncbi:XdhC family protein [Acidobacteriota bacterium]